MYKPKIIRQDSLFKSNKKTELDAIELLIKDIDIEAEAQFAKEKDKKEKDEKDKLKKQIVMCQIKYRDNVEPKFNKGNNSSTNIANLNYAQTISDLSKIKNLRPNEIKVME